MAKNQDSKRDRISSDLSPQSLQGLDDRTLANFLLRNENGRPAKESWSDKLKDWLLKTFTRRW